jgi:hypothetical protein
MLDNVSKTHSITGLWSTQTKVEGIVLRAAWHWGTDSRVVNDAFGEPSCTLLYVGLPPALGSVDGDFLFSLWFMGELFNWELHEV